MADGNQNSGKGDPESAKIAISGTNSPTNKISPPDNGTCEVGDLAKRFERPVPIGVSAGIAGFGGGTYGARVKDAAGNLYMLSNNHIFAGNNKASIGTVGFQPRPLDSGKELANAVGSLMDFEPLRFCAFSSDFTPMEACQPNLIDVAILSTTSELSGLGTPCDGYGVPKKVTTLARAGMKIMKYGRTTGLTNGIIRATNATVDVSYGRYPDGRYMVARFTGQILAVPTNNQAIVMGGDSGSLVVNEEGNPVGLVFGGGNRVAVINPIGPILERFGVTVDGL
jgi:hypothetical protein